MLIHFNYWPSKFDVWLDWNSERIQPRGSKKWIPNKSFRTGHVIDCLDLDADGHATAQQPQQQRRGARQQQGSSVSAPINDENAPPQATSSGAYASASAGAGSGGVAAAPGSAAHAVGAPDQSEHDDRDGAGWSSSQQSSSSSQPQQIPQPQQAHKWRAAIIRAVERLQPAVNAAAASVSAAHGAALAGPNEAASGSTTINSGSSASAGARDDQQLRRLKIHWKGFSESFDEWLYLPRDNYRIAEVESRTRKPVQYVPKAKRAQANVLQKQSKERKALIIPDTADGRYIRYCLALAQHGLAIMGIAGDGNCLFRSIAHQIYGNQELHGVVRKAAADYMSVERDYFASFTEIAGSDAASSVADGGASSSAAEADQQQANQAQAQAFESFDAYLANIRRDGTWGDEPELQALCELYNRPAEIWAFHPAEGAKLICRYNSNAAEVGAGAGAAASSSSLAAAGGASQLSGSGRSRPPIRLSFYGGGHYDSVIPIQSYTRIDPHAATQLLQLLHAHMGAIPARITAQFQAGAANDWEGNWLPSTPGELEDQMIQAAQRRRAMAGLSSSLAAGGAGVGAAGSSAVLSEAAIIAASMSGAQQREASEMNAALQLSRKQFESQDQEDLEAALLVSMGIDPSSAAIRSLLPSGALGQASSSSSAGAAGAGAAASSTSVLGLGLDEDAQVRLALQRSIAEDGKSADDHDFSGCGTDSMIDDSDLDAALRASAALYPGRPTVGISSAAGGAAASAGSGSMVNLDHDGAAYEAAVLEEARRASLMEYTSVGSAAAAAGAGSLAPSSQQQSSSSSSAAGNYHADADAMYEAALQLTEDEQLQCALAGLTADEFVRMKQARSGTDASSSQQSAAAAAAGQRGTGRPPANSAAMDEEDPDLALALLLSTQST